MALRLGKAGRTIKQGSSSPGAQRRNTPPRVEGTMLRKISGRQLAAPALIKKIEAGLPVTALEELRSKLELPMERLASWLRISKATLHRRKASGKLDAGESDRVVRFARLLGRATDVLESVQSARLWLRAPQHGLGGAIPLEYAQTEVGAREVEDLLGRIDQGVYS